MSGLSGLLGSIVPGSLGLFPLLGEPFRAAVLSDSPPHAINVALMVISRINGQQMVFIEILRQETFPAFILLINWVASGVEKNDSLIIETQNEE
jgi:hypothetical protein